MERGDGMRKAQMHLAQFLCHGPTYHSLAMWRHPRTAAAGHDWARPELYQHIARVCERGRFDMVFFADLNYISDTFTGSLAPALRNATQAPEHDPIPLLSFMAAATTTIGLGATYSVSHQHPFHAARLWATLDHLTRGRAAWNVVTSLNHNQSANYGEEYRPTDDRYDRAHEFIQVCRKLWESWDEDAVDFIEQFNPGLYKLASASLTDLSLIEKVKATGKPFILSTGMSTMNEITEAVSRFTSDKLLIAHSTSAYPCPPEELNLKMIYSLSMQYPEIPLGYSGHETGLATTLAAVAMGACFIERHFTLDRAMWGSDQAASVEPQGMQRLAKDIRDIEKSLGDGIKKVYDSEMSAMKRLRRKYGMVNS